MKHVRILFATTLVMTALAGCTSSSPASYAMAAQCMTVACIKASNKDLLVRQCLRDLMRYESRSRAGRERILAEYRYPLTSWETYNSWTQMGNSGPSPDGWCRAYASAKIRWYERNS